VWHNKSKARAYGELFRTGDTVSVTLDLDKGTMSFSLNGKDLGVASDGLNAHLPLYAAFSLYNEDDQLSIVPPRAAAAANAAVAALSASSAAAEASDDLSALIDRAINAADKCEAAKKAAASAYALSASAAERTLDRFGYMTTIKCNNNILLLIPTT
jgi:hypothetical protein